MTATDPRLLIHGAHADGKPHAAITEYQGWRNDLKGWRWRIFGTGTLDLGYVIGYQVDAEGNRTNTNSGSTRYQATTRDGELLEDPTPVFEDAVAWIVGAAHSQHPEPDHTVPNVGGRPPVGQPINVRLGDELLAWLDGFAARNGVSRPEQLRRIVDAARTADVST